MLRELLIKSVKQETGIKLVLVSPGVTLCSHGWQTEESGESTKEHWDRINVWPPLHCHSYGIRSRCGCHAEIPSAENLSVTARENYVL